MNDSKSILRKTRRRIIYVFGLSTLIAILVASVSRKYVLENRALHHWKIDHQFVAAAFASQCENEVAEALNDLKFVSTISSFSKLPDIGKVDPAIHGIPENADVEKRDLLRQLMGTGERFSVLYVAAPNGDLYLVCPFEDQLKLDRSSLSDRPYFQEAERTKKPVISDSFIGANGSMTVAMLVPVRDKKGNITAYLGGAYYLTTLSRLVEKTRIEPFDSGFLVDRKGFLIAHTDTGLLKAGLREGFVDHPMVAEFLAQSHGTLKKDGSEVTIREHLDPIDGKHYITAFVPLQPGWGVGLSKNKKSILAEIGPEIWQRGALVGILFLVVNGIGMLVAQRIGKRWEGAEQELRENEELFRSTFDQAAVGIAHVSPERKWLRVNQRLCDIVGYSQKELLSSTVQDITHPDDLEKDFQYAHQMLHGEIQTYSMEKRYIRKDGSLVWINLTASMVREDSGEPKYFISVVEDISDRKNAMEKIAHLNAVLRAIRNINQLITREKDRDRLLQGACDSMVETRGFFSAWIALLDESGQLLSSAESGLRDSFPSIRERFRRGELPECGNRALKQSGVAVIKDPKTTCAGCPLLKEYPGKGSMTVRLEYDGKTYGLMSVSMPVEVITEKQEIFLFQEVVDDIAFALHNMELEKKRKEAEQEIGIRNRIIQIFLTIPDEDIYGEVMELILDVMESEYGVFGYIDEDGALVVPSMTRHVWDKCRVPEKDIVFPCAAWGDSAWPQCIREKRIICSNAPSTRIPEGHVPIKRQISLPILYQENVIGLFQVANKETDYDEKDIALFETIGSHIAPILSARLNREWEEKQRKKAEANLMRLNQELEQRVMDRTARLEVANKDLEAFSYSVSHDLRTPLRAIEGFSNILTEDYSSHLDPEGQRIITVIIHNVKKMGQLIDDLLSFSRLDRKQIRKEMFNMNQLVGEVIGQLEPIRGSRNIEFKIGPLPPACADRALIHEVLINLIENAIKFTANSDPAVIEVGSRSEAAENIYYVKDNGAGFNMKYAEKVFGVFQRLHSLKQFKGTGIGLALVKSIVVKHGGRVWGEGKENQGAAFYFTLSGKE